MKIPKIIHHIWYGPKSNAEAAYFYSQIKNHPKWKICQWTDTNSPKLTCPLASHAATSNVLRLWALYEFGGIYLDADVEVLKPFDPLLDHEAFIARQPDGPYCNAIMGAIPKHPWIKWMLDKAIAEQEFHDASFCCHMIEDSPMKGVSVLPTDYFYSWNWNEESKEASPNAYALHWWNKSWIPKEDGMTWP